MEFLGLSMALFMCMFFWGEDVVVVMLHQTLQVRIPNGGELRLGAVLWANAECPQA